MRPDIIDKNGNFRTKPIGEIGKRNLSDSRIALLQSIYKLIDIDGFLSKETRLYISDPYITMSGINKIMNEESQENPHWNGKEININTTYAKIGYDRSNKLDKQLGTTIITDIVYKSQNNDVIAEYARRVAALYSKVNKGGDNDKLRNNLVLPLRNDVLCSELTSEKFDDFIKTILPYIKEHVDEVANEMDQDAVGYFNYLLYSPVLSDTDKIRLDRLRSYLDPSYEPNIEIE